MIPGLHLVVGSEILMVASVAAVMVEVVVGHLEPIVAEAVHMDEVNLVTTGYVVALVNRGVPSVVYSERYGGSFNRGYDVGGTYGGAGEGYGLYSGGSGYGDLDRVMQGGYGSGGTVTFY